MPDIRSAVTELPASCKSAADRMAGELAKEDVYAELSEKCHQKITSLEKDLSKELGEKVALVVYRV